MRSRGQAHKGAAILALALVRYVGEEVLVPGAVAVFADVTWRG